MVICRGVLLAQDFSNGFDGFSASLSLSSLCQQPLGAPVFLGPLVSIGFQEVIGSGIMALLCFNMLEDRFLGNQLEGNQRFAECKRSAKQAQRSRNTDTET